MELEVYFENPKYILPLFLAQNPNFFSSKELEVYFENVFLLIL